MSAKAPTDLPIGYWLKRVHDLLDAAVAHAQAAHGLSRLDWQVLNALWESGTADAEDVHARLQPFADTATIMAALDRLLQRGMAGRTAHGDALALTVRGEAVHAAALAAQRELRGRAMNGVSEAEYEMVLMVLRRVADNLEDALRREAETGS